MAPIFVLSGILLVIGIPLYVFRHHIDAVSERRYNRPSSPSAVVGAVGLIVAGLVALAVAFVMLVTS